MSPFRRRGVLLAEVLAALGLLVQCTPTAPPHATAPPSSIRPSITPSITSPAGPAPSSPTPTSGTIRSVTAAELGASWQPGCPVEPAQLRRISLEYIGFDGMTHPGEIIVHQDLAAEVIQIFERLSRLGYPVEKMRTVEHYPDADDELSMEDNNTSGFNCRRIPGSDEWSPHAFGRAIDINPLINPCLYAGGYFEPHNAAAYLDRGRTDPGLLHGGDPAERAFTDRGWQWGGYWRTPDYQHFERS